MDNTGKHIRLILNHGISTVTSVICLVRCVNEYGWYLKVVETGGYENSVWKVNSVHFIGHSKPLHFIVLEE